MNIAICFRIKHPVIEQKLTTLKQQQSEYIDGPHNIYAGNDSDWCDENDTQYYKQSELNITFFPFNHINKQKLLKLTSYTTYSNIIIS